MNDYLIPIVAAFIVITIILFTWMAAYVRKEMRESRKEITSYMQVSFQTMHRTSSEQAMQQEQKLELMRQTLENRLHMLQQDNNLQLERMRQTVDEKLQQTLEERISKSFEAVRQSLDEVYRGLGEMQTLATGVGDLKKVLSNVKTRGIVGEIQLAAILEQILTKEQYSENVATRPGAGERVEFAVRMPGDGGQSCVWLPIDAKFHGDTYANLMDAYETADAAEIGRARKLLVDALRKSAKDIRDKYVEPPATTDFAVLFVPFEGLYAEAVNLGVMEAVQQDYKVMLAGPATMAALLNSLQMGFKTLAIQKHSGQVWDVLGAVKSEFDKFGTVLALTQQRLVQANEELDKLVGTRTRSIQRTLRGVQDLSGEMQKMPHEIRQELQGEE